MSRKDYVVVAEAIRRVAEILDGTQESVAPLVMAAEEIAAAFANDNDRFDRERFLAAALGEEN